MTAPVITVPEKMAMTAPVITTKKDLMQFILPFDYTSVDQVPVPNNKRITIKAVNGRTIAVTKFSGSYNRIYCMEKLNELHQQLREDKMLSDSDSDVTPQELDSEKELTWSVAQYHPPFTIPFLRRNEVWVELNRKQSSVLDSLMTKFEQEQHQLKDCEE